MGTTLVQSPPVLCQKMMEGKVHNVTLDHHSLSICRPDNTKYLVIGSITVRLTSCLMCLDSGALLMANEIYLIGQFQTNQT